MPAMKRIIIFLLLALLVGGGAAVSMLPMSMAAEFAAKRAPAFKYAEATGSVWDGKLTKVVYGTQKIGDLSVKADLLQAFTGKAAANLSFARDKLIGSAGIAWPIGGKEVALSNVKVSGPIGMAPGVPQVVAVGGGTFTLELKDLKFAGEVCTSAKGEVWTDALAKVDYKGWVGPELRGPVTCTNGKVQVEATGNAPAGEDVTAVMTITPRLDMEVTASVTNAQGPAVAAFTDMGFKAEGNALVIRQAIGS
jgi:hypothetical protein